MSDIPQLTFPYPTIGKIKRPDGEGCTACIHKRYCGAYYWYIRFQERTMSSDFGCACNSFSSDKIEIIREKNEGDFYQVDKWTIDRIAQEPNQNGCDEP